jgi:hypothetical protein
MLPCPCCGYEVFAEPPGSYDICPICFWEDDVVQLAFPDLAGGANGCSLIEGQATFSTLGACEPRVKPHVRDPVPSDLRNSAWRQLDATRDRYLRWDRQDDHRMWQAAKDSDPCLYYWLPEYWLVGKAEQSDGADGG